MSLRYPKDIYYARESKSGKWLSVNADSKVIKWDFPEPLTLTRLNLLQDLTIQGDVEVYKLVKRE